MNIKKTPHIGIFIFKSKKALINLFHNSGLFIYSFICIIISFSDLVSMCKKNSKEFLLLNEVRKANYHLK